MRRLILQMNMSLDGYISDAVGEIDWHFADEEFQDYIDETLQSIDGMIFGRVASEELAAFWPNAGSEVSPIQAERMHALPKYVLSRTLTDTAWNNSHILGGDIATAITELKEQEGKDLFLFAGGKAGTAALQLGLVDQVRIILNPALLSGGTRLFDGQYPRAELRLVHTRQLGSGALVLTYELPAPSSPGSE